MTGSGNVGKVNSRASSGRNKCSQCFSETRTRSSASEPSVGGRVCSRGKGSRTHVSRPASFFNDSMPKPIRERRKFIDCLIIALWFFCFVLFFYLVIIKVLLKSRSVAAVTRGERVQSGGNTGIGQGGVGVSWEGETSSFRVG